MEIENLEETQATAGMSEIEWEGFMEWKSSIDILCVWGDLDRNGRQGWSVNDCCGNVLIVGRRSKIIEVRTRITINLLF